jgi:hypothetical protein
MAPVPSVESHDLIRCQRLAPVSGDTATVTHEVYRKVAKCAHVRISGENERTSIPAAHARDD